MTASSPRHRSFQRFSEQTLYRLRSLSFDETIDILGLYAKDDSRYKPIKNKDSRRVHVSIENAIVEFVVTHQKWYDPQMNHGGSGGIDLTMHLYREAFPQAVKRLNACFQALPTCARQGRTPGGESPPIS